MQSYDTVLAIIEEAHLNGMRVAVHATELETARLAVQAGADILVHAIDDRPVDDAFIDALKARDVIVITTAVVYEHLGQLRSNEIVLSSIEKTLGDPIAIASWEETPLELKSPAIADFINGRVKTVLANLKTLADAGVRVAVGTDAGNPGTLHGPSIHRELALLERAGFSPKQILKAATIDAAAVFAAEPDFGSAEIGKRADLLVLRENPTQNVKAFQAIERVVVDGVSYNPSSLAPFSAAALVQRQLEAYNTHDIEAFAAAYAKDVVIFKLPERKTNTRGRKALISQYDRLFKELKPNCRVLSRIIEGNFVIDQEFCVFGDTHPLRATVIYQIEDKLIRRVWFVKGQWCGREDSNFHGCYPTATSTLRVYQFRHGLIKAIAGKFSELADTLETVTDEDSARKAAAKIAAIGKDMEALANKVDTGSASTKISAVMQANSKEFRDSQGRMVKQLARLAITKPELMEIIAEEIEKLDL